MDRSGPYSRVLVTLPWSDWPTGRFFFYRKACQNPITNVSLRKLRLTEEIGGLLGRPGPHLKTITFVHPPHGPIGPILQGFGHPLMVRSAHGKLFFSERHAKTQSQMSRLLSPMGRGGGTGISTFFFSMKFAAIFASRKSPFFFFNHHILAVRGRPDTAIFNMNFFKKKLK